jgi:hypothetical protein
LIAASPSADTAMDVDCTYGTCAVDPAARFRLVPVISRIRRRPAAVSVTE